MLNIKYKTTKLLEGNIGEHLCKYQVGKDFLNMTLMHDSYKNYVNYVIKIKKYVLQKTLMLRE